MRSNKHNRGYDASLVKVLTNNAVYRIGDIFYQYGIRWQQDATTILTDNAYANTVLHSYLTQQRYPRDIDVFRRVVKQHATKYDAPSHDDIVVHVRLGDVMDAYDKRAYSRSLANYKRLLPTVPWNGFARAVIVTALHFGANDINGKYFYADSAYTRSHLLLRHIIKSIPIPVAIQSSDNVDEDICYMSGAENFVEGFTKLAGLITQCLPRNAKIWSTNWRQP